MSQPSSDAFRGAALSARVDKWREITSSDTILNWISKGVSIPFIRTPTQPVWIQNYKQYSSDEKCFITEEIRKLCAQKCIVQCRNRPYFVSPLNIAPKSDGTYRLILDLRELNKCCKPKTFIYEDINTVVNLIQPGDNLVTLDLKSAFFHIASLYVNSILHFWDLNGRGHFTNLWYYRSVHALALTFVINWCAQ